MTNQYNQALVILGMHRSGTSAFAGTAVRLGVTPPRIPLPTSSDNPTGFYEARSVVLANQDILLQAGCAWNVCLTFEPDRLSSPPAARQFILNTLRGEFGDTASFVLKDPRLCLTLPVWLPALQDAAAEVRVLIVLRHPAEVARSLAVRNQVPEADAVAQWLHHMLEAERATRGLNRAFVSYEDLMRDWRGCVAKAAEIAGIRWPCSIDVAGPDIDAFLAMSLRHHAMGYVSAHIGLPRVRDMINAAWVVLRSLVQTPADPAASAYLDHIRTHFAAWRRAAFPPGFRAAFPASTAAKLAGHAQHFGRL